MLILSSCLSRIFLKFIAHIYIQIVVSECPQGLYYVRQDQWEGYLWKPYLEMRTVRFPWWIFNRNYINLTQHITLRETPHIWSHYLVLWSLFNTLISSILNLINELAFRCICGSYVNCCQVSQHAHEVTSWQPRLPTVLRVLMESELVLLGLRKLNNVIRNSETLNTILLRYKFLA
jgi:hypothetical protein